MQGKRQMNGQNEREDGEYENQERKKKLNRTNNQRYNWRKCFSIGKKEIKLADWMCQLILHLDLSSGIQKKNIRLNCFQIVLWLEIRSYKIYCLKASKSAREKTS